MIVLGIALAFNLVHVTISTASASVTEDFAHARSLLEQSLKTPVSLDPLLSNTPSAGCSFQSVCQVFAANWDAPYLYQNERGEQIPNLRLSYYEQELSSCFATQTQLAATAQNPYKKQAELQIQIAKSEVQFYKSVEKNGEEKLWHSLQLGQLQQALAESEKSFADENFNPVYPANKTEKQIQAELTDFETRAGTQFSPETRGLYLSWQKSFEPPQEPIQTWQAINPNAFLNFSLLNDNRQAGGAPTVARNQALYQEKLNRAYEIFGHVKHAVIQRLSHSIHNPAQLDQMTKRLQSVAFTIPNLSVCLRGPNAYYNAQSQSFYICPQFLEYPKAALIRMMSHELAHSVDPCNLSYPLISFQGDRVQPPKQSMADQEQQKKYYEQMGIQFFSPHVPSQRAADQEIGTDVRDSSRLLKNKFTRSEQSTLSEGIAFAEYPLSSVVQCLASEDSVQARLPDVNQIARDLQQAIDTNRAAGMKDTHPEMRSLLKTLQDLPTFVRSHEACKFIPSEKGSSQINEAFADWMAAEVLAEEVHQTGLSSSGVAQRVLAIEGFSDHLSLGCPAPTTRLTTDLDAELTRLGCRRSDGGENLAVILQAQKSAKNEHSSTVTTVERLLLAHPYLRQALGCEMSSGAKYCE